MLVRDATFFGVSFPKQKINLGVSFLVKSKAVINFGVSFQKNNSFDQISLTWLKFWIVVTILGYTFSLACKFWGIVFAKICKF